MALGIMISTFGCVNGLILSGGACLLRDGARRLVLQCRGHAQQRGGCQPQRWCSRGVWAAVLNLVRNVR